MKQINESTGAKINIHNEICPKSTDKVAQITGTSESIAEAVGEILRLFEDFSPKGNQFLYDPHNYDGSYEYGGYGGPSSQNQGAGNYGQAQNGPQSGFNANKNNTNNNNNTRNNYQANRPVVGPFTAVSAPVNNFVSTNSAFQPINPARSHLNSINDPNPSQITQIYNPHINQFINVPVEQASFQPKIFGAGQFMFLGGAR